MRISFTIFLIVLIASCNTKQSSTPYLKPGAGLVDVEGGKVWYGIMGEGSQAPYVCLHGGPGGTSRRYFDMEPLTDDRPIIMIDQLGSGQSTHHTDTSLLKVENFVEQVNAVVKHLKLKEYYLTGHSWGTALALECYEAHPEGIKGIVFNSPYFSTPKWIAGTNQLVSEMPDSIQQAIAIANRDSVYDSEAYKKANAYFSSQHLLRTKSSKHPYDTVQAPGSGFIYNYMWGPSEFRATGTLRNYDNIDALKKLNVPVLFTTGQYDEARPEDVKQYVKMVKDAEYVEIPNAGHASMSDNLPVYLKAHREFANKVDTEE
ncbi:proline iminopeptidase-family hydrolase [Fulvivirga sediminis]|uniref:Proline iminopeptidase-family hydrolase n=1 Tax=Fulvivirga sediminis TaxID=2803949 RepID=A0A937F6G0_9BACT|nr:proline iminopeptidase-family hydrolase [Fulvivirga sediminis]MBL3655129.1 proline iminopeptidase-family hydrolase [Fulvivirga sediminis]